MMCGLVCCLTASLLQQSGWALIKSLNGQSDKAWIQMSFFFSSRNTSVLLFTLVYLDLLGPSPPLFNFVFLSWAVGAVCTVGRVQSRRWADVQLSSICSGQDERAVGALWEGSRASSNGKNARKQTVHLHVIVNTVTIIHIILYAYVAVKVIEPWTSPSVAFSKRWAMLLQG